MLDKTHTTREGDKMLIAEMETDHLLNVVGLIVGQIDKAMQTVKGATPNAMLMKLHGVHIPDEDEIVSVVNKRLDFLAPYLVELYIRLDAIVGDEKTHYLGTYHSYSKVLADAIGRTGKISPVSRIAGYTAKRLASGVSYDFDDPDILDVFSEF